MPVRVLELPLKMPDIVCINVFFWWFGCIFVTFLVGELGPVLPSSLVDTIPSSVSMLSDAELCCLLVSLCCCCCVLEGSDLVIDSFTDVWEVCLGWLRILLEVCSGTFLLEGSCCSLVVDSTFFGLLLAAACCFLAFLATGMPNLAGSVSGVAGKDIGGSVAALILLLVGVL